MFFNLIEWLGKLKSMSFPLLLDKYRYLSTMRMISDVNLNPRKHSVFHHLHISTDTCMLDVSTNTCILYVCIRTGIPSITFNLLMIYYVKNYINCMILWYIQRIIRQREDF